MSGTVAVPVDGSLEVTINRDTSVATPVVAPVVTPDVPVTTQVEKPVVETPVEVPVVAAAPKDTPVQETATDAMMSVLNLEDDAVFSAMEKALHYGDAELIDLATLTKGKSEKEAAAITRVVTAKFSEAQAQERQVLTEVHGLAGGEDNWSAVQEVFNNKAPQHLKEGVGAAIAKRNLKAAAQIAIDFAKSQGLVSTSTGNPQIAGGTGGNAEQGITYAEMRTGMREIQQKYPRADLEGNSPAAQEYKALVAKRELGVRLGK